MASLTLPLVWSTLPPISVDLSPPSLPASSLTLPLAWSHLPSILSSISYLLRTPTCWRAGQEGANPLPRSWRPGAEPSDSYHGCVSNEQFHLRGGSHIVAPHDRRRHGPTDRAPARWVPRAALRGPRPRATCRGTQRGCASDGVSGRRGVADLGAYGAGRHADPNRDRRSERHRRHGTHRSGRDDAARRRRPERRRERLPPGSGQGGPGGAPPPA